MPWRIVRTLKAGHGDTTRCDGIDGDPCPTVVDEYLTLTDGHRTQFRACCWYCLDTIHRRLAESQAVTEGATP